MLVRRGFLLVLLTLAALTTLHAQPQVSAHAPMGIGLENFDYPYPVRYFDLVIEGKQLRMAYGDMKPAGKDRAPTVLLLHGKNFFGAYWQTTIRFLTKNGFRVIIPDQIGFGKSSKPNIHYSFQRMAQSTGMLLDQLGIGKVALLGHSMGGMLAARFALMYPERSLKLVLENPIGLEDYRLKVPYRSVEDWYSEILNYTDQGILDSHRRYYAQWKDKFANYANVHAAWTRSADYPRLAWSSALTYQMIYLQPVLYEFPALQVPTLLIIGQEDRTTLGHGVVSDSVLASMGNYPELGRKAAAAIPGAKLKEMDGVGHIPHLEQTSQFHIELLTFLK